MMAADMSYRLGWIDEQLVQRIRALNEKAKLPVAPPSVRALSATNDVTPEPLHPGRCGPPLPQLQGYPLCFYVPVLSAEHDGGAVPQHDGCGQEGAGREAAAHPAQVS